MAGPGAEPTRGRRGQAQAQRGAEPPELLPSPGTECAGTLGVSEPNPSTGRRGVDKKRSFRDDLRFREKYAQAFEVLGPSHGRGRGTKTLIAH